MTPLFENIALRTSDILGDFNATFVLQHRYGDLTKTRFKLGKVTDTLYFVADHPMASVDSVQESGQDIIAWRWFTRGDKFGVTSTYVELAQPVNRIDAVVTASGKGKLSPLTGELIENPADIIQDVVSLNGRQLVFPLFREECARRGLRFAGSLDEIKRLRLYIANIVDSIGAKWVNDSVLIYPQVISYAEKLNSYTEPSYRATTEKQAGSIKVAYNFNEGSNRYGSFVVVKAVGSPYANERIEYCKWLRDNKNAVELATRLCKYYAGKHVEVTTEVAGYRHSGDMLSLEGAFFANDFTVFSAIPEPQSTKIVGDMVLELWGATRLTNYTAEVPITQQEGIELDFDNGVLTITIYDTDNKPFVGAFVSLDKSTPKKTNGNGRVTFRTAPGGHVLDIAAPGFDSINNLPIEVR